MNQSPFLTHRSILLSSYSTAIALRGFTLSLWNGRNWPADLSRVAGMDEKHFAIAMELITWYRQYGEDDPDFMETGRACEAMALEAKRQAEQQKAYDEWERQVNRSLGARGIDSSLSFDNYEWFFARFEQGLTPVQAVEQAIAHGLNDKD
ncbi:MULTISPECIES: DUF7673 family protein [Aeromonas]|uniref:DUF7673 family protein n=1 Tax=Aeromonas TaxID=642 RepID=UPI00111BC91E|nr:MULTISPECIES: hypothetical protein [Aeromonas]TNI42182.1 hypothetical protein CF130_16655 [Aeromonas dhakensis]BDO10913.1 hypothetical protein KAM643c_44860 [Aeromonas caviae]GKR80581.1 hypothetical protein KAM481_40510 [Aeromonas caviae]